MRVMVLVQGNADSEAGVLPTTDELNEMGAFNEQLVQAGVMLAGEGLHETAKGKRVRFGGKGDKSTVVDGPFTESKEIIAGFWIWQVASIDEAVEWVQRAPFRDTHIDIRPVFEAEDFGDNLTPEMAAREAALREQAAQTGQ